MTASIGVCHTARGLRPFGRGAGGVGAGSVSVHSPVADGGSDTVGLSDWEVTGTECSGVPALAVQAATPMVSAAATGKSIRTANVDMVVNSLDWAVGSRPGCWNVRSAWASEVHWHMGLQPHFVPARYLRFRGQAARNLS